jgi:hypothetical protein
LTPEEQRGQDRTTAMAERERRAITASRLRAAWRLIKEKRVKVLSTGRVAVAGNVEPYYIVDLSQDPPCHCRDVEYRGAQIRQNCKHTLAARLAKMDPALLGTIADWIVWADELPQSTSDAHR